MVYIYVNGEMVLERECKDGARIELPVSGGKCSVDICIFTKQGNRAGITKPVVVLE